MNRRSVKVERIAKTVFQITGIREMSSIGVIAKEHKGRGIDGNLIGKDDLQAAMVEIGRGIHRLRIADDIIQKRRGYPS